MFGNSKKNATTMIELLILLAIVGILTVMYQKVINQEALSTKYSFIQVMKNMEGYGATASNGYQNSLGDLNGKICNNFFHSINTLGEKNCISSTIPDVANLTTINGMRFFGLDRAFQKDAEGNGYLFISVDVDGVAGKNREGVDILNFELTQDGHVHPTGAPIISGGSLTTLKGNVARDPELFVGTATYMKVPETEEELKKATADGKDLLYINLGNRLSYTEAQCLTGNPFPYRATDGKIQMCVYKEDIYNKRNTVTSDVDSAMKEYWKTIQNGEICSQLYSSDKSGAYGLVKATDAVLENCKRCYRAAYKAKYCKNYSSANVAEGCTDAILKEKGACVASNYVEE